jgi:hypothetical protein
VSQAVGECLAQLLDVGEVSVVGGADAVRVVGEEGLGFGAGGGAGGGVADVADAEVALVGVLFIFWLCMCVGGWVCEKWVVEERGRRREEVRVCVRVDGCVCVRSIYIRTRRLSM